MRDTFLIQQTPNSINLYLYPMGDSGATVLTASDSIGSNSSFIDEDRKLPDINTYVYWDDNGLLGQGSTGSDMYEITDHTTESGTINNVTVYCRAKSHFYVPSSSATFDILLRASGTTYKSSEATYGTDIQLNNQYNTYTCNWTSNPAKQNAWTWTDIDEMKIGLVCSTPSKLYTGVNMKLVPASKGVHDYLTPVGYSNNWQCVNTIETDSYVENVDPDGLNFRLDDYNLETYDVSVTTGTINHISLSCIAIAGSGGLAKGYPYYYISSTTYPDDTNDDFPGDGSVAYGNFWADSSGWNTYSSSTVVNPSTSNPWLWHEIALTDFGYYYKASEAAGYGRLSHFYAHINYDAFTNPEIRVTQMYAKVNYNPAATNISLNKPSSYSLGHSREIKRQRFWNADDAVYDLQRGTKTISMTGLEYDTASSEATDILSSVKTQADNGVEITISGMDDTNLNTTWFISSFNWSQDEKNPNIYNWNMEAEKA